MGGFFVGFHQAAEVGDDFLWGFHHGGLDAVGFSCADEAPGIDGSRSEVLHGPDDGIGDQGDGVGVHVVHGGGDAAMDAFHEADLGGVVGVLGGDSAGQGIGDVLEPVCDDHVVSESFDEGLEEVVVVVDEAGE